MQVRAVKSPVLLQFNLIVELYYSQNGGLPDRINVPQAETTRKQLRTKVNYFPPLLSPISVGVLMVDPDEGADLYS